MNDAHNGKISRLPHQIREQVHTRLRDGERGKTIVAWLDSIPEVTQMLAASFGGHPISETNLTRWKTRAHRAWLLEQAALGESRRFVSESRQLSQAGQGAITDHLATFVAASYALARQRLSGEERLQWKYLRAFCHDVAILRRGDHCVQRMRLQRDELEFKAAVCQTPNSPGIQLKVLGESVKL